MALVAAPLVVNPLGLHPSGATRSLLLAAVLLGVVVVSKLAPRFDDRWLLAAGSLILVCTLFSGAPAGSFRGGGLVGYGSLGLIAIMVAVWLASSLEPSDDVRHVTTAVAAGALGLAAAGLAWRLYPLAGSPGVVKGRWVGPMGNATTFGLWSGVLGVAAIAGATNERGRVRWLLVVAGAVSGASVVLSGSRAAVVGVIAGLVAIWCSKVARSTTQRMAGAAALALSGAALIWFVSLYVGASGLRSKSLAGRSDLLASGWAAFVDRPLFGWGMGRLPVALPANASPGLARSIVNGGGPSTTGFWPADVLAELGLFGGLLVVGLAGAALVALWPNGERGWDPILCGGGVAFLAGRMFSGTHLDVDLMGAVLVGLALATVQRPIGGGPEKSSTVAGAARRGRFCWVRPCVVATLILNVVFAGFDVMSDSAARSTYQLANAGRYNAAMQSTQRGTAPSPGLTESVELMSQFGSRMSESDLSELSKLANRSLRWGWGTPSLSLSAANTQHVYDRRFVGTSAGCGRSREVTTAYPYLAPAWRSLASCLRWEGDSPGSRAAESRSRELVERSLD